jgi:acyl-CoA synthetase (AMP-forming)/AMP-acid ligase II
VHAGGTAKAVMQRTPASPDRNVASTLARAARSWPTLPALALGTAEIRDYATLAVRVSRLAGVLLAGGLRPGDRVALVSRNAPAYVETLFACWWAGLVAVPVNAKLHTRELAYVLADSEARWVFADRHWQEEIEPLREDLPELDRVVELGGDEYERGISGTAPRSLAPCAGEDRAWLFYTSGTTGRPKGVEITHGNLRAMSEAFVASVDAIAPGDALLHPAPLSHGSGLYLVPHVAGGAVNVLPETGGFDADEVCALINAWDRAGFFASPTIVKRLVQASAIGSVRLDRLKVIVYGGGPMYVADAKAAFAVLGPRLAQIYGQGESPMTITAMNRDSIADAIERGDESRLGSVGTPQVGMELRIADRDDRELPTGEVGEILVRGPAVMRGYWRNPEATSSALAHGWLHTGDVGSVDADGYLTLKDRSKDLIISGGSNIYPREVEEALLSHPAVVEIAVVGRTHPDWGEEAVACVVIRGGGAPTAERARSLEREFDAWCLERIARFKRPRAYVFFAELPKNNTGKVLKTELRRAVSVR